MPDGFGNGRKTVPETQEGTPLTEENPQSLRSSPRMVAAGSSQPPVSEPICPDDELVGRQLIHAQALVACAGELMASCETDDANRSVLQRALEHLRVVADVDRAFIFRNLDDERVGSASAMVAEARGSLVPSHMPAHAIPVVGDPHPEALTPSEMLPWSSVPERNRKRLATGGAVGGVLAELFAETPDFLARLRADA